MCGLRPSKFRLKEVKFRCRDASKVAKDVS